MSKFGSSAADALKRDCEESMRDSLPTSSPVVKVSRDEWESVYFDIKDDAMFFDDFIEWLKVHGMEVME